MQIIDFRLSLLCLLFVRPACDGRPSIDWNRKDAHRHCSGAIAAYPEAPAPPCRAMHMCMNEAKLTPEEADKLLVMIKAAPGCREP